MEQVALGQGLWVRFQKQIIFEQGLGNEEDWERGQNVFLGDAQKSRGVRARQESRKSTLKEL